VYSLITLSLSQSSFLPPELAVAVVVGLSALRPASKSYSHQDLCHTPGHESLSVSSLSLPSSNGGLGWCTGENPTPATKLPNSTDLHHFVKKLLHNNSSRICASMDDAVLLPYFPPSDSTACLPACNGQPSPVQHEARKEGRKDGWMNGWMDENWVHLLLYNQGLQLSQLPNFFTTYLTNNLLPSY
jgi:hypothetical protein